MMRRIVILLLICLSNGWLFANHWTPNDSEYEDNMTLTGVIQIDGIEQQSTALEVGVFCGEECRGSGYPTYFLPTQRYVIQLLIFGEVGDSLTFKLFDSDSGQELDLISPEAVIFNANGYGSLFDPYILDFTGNSTHWIPNDSDYEDNMTLIGVIQINEVEQQSTTLEMGVFCGEECRGTGLATYFFPTQRYVVQVLIFGETGDPLTFKLYDHALGQELNLTSPEAITFTANGYGTLGSPYVLNFTGEIEEITQTIALSAGWNWFSTYLNITLDDLKAALVEAVPNTTITIKSQTQNTKYQNGRWTGQLTALDMTQMYMISVENDCEITLVGTLVDPSTLTVTINNGANWIAFPFSESMTVTNFFGSFPVNNDQVKSQSQNARYQGNRWAGQLNTLMPGKGYIYNSNTQGTRILTFPVGTK